MGKRIKILITIPNFDTAGSGRVVYDLIKGLDKLKFEPEICCCHDQGSYFETIKTLDVKIHLFDFATPYRPFLTFPFRLLKIVRFFKTHKFDLIHSWHWSSDVSEPLAAKLAGIPFVYTKKSMGWGNRSWKWRSQFSTKIITINTDMVTQFFSDLSHKVVQIPLGVDVDYFNSIHFEKINKTSFNLKQKDRVVLTVANLVKVKGIEILLEAALKINKKYIKVFVVGDDTTAYGKALKEKYSAHKNIIFFGKQLDVRPYLNIADVFVIPTRILGEGLPIAPLEAMACSRIVIGSKVPGVKDILKPFPDFLFKPNQIDDLRCKLETTFSLNEKEKNDLEQKMRSHVMLNFNISNFIDKHELLYKDIIR